MAVHLISSIAQIPASPAAGDIIRFSAAITTGIPSTLKKIDGTTQETAIGVGSEYRYFSPNWLKIGSDVSATPLKDAPVLAATEFSNAILAAVHNETASGRIRKFGIAILHKALQAVNPLQLEFEDVVLYERTADADIPESSATLPIDLDIKTGVTRHNFNDGYYAFTFFRGRNSYATRNPDGFNHSDDRFVSKARWFATQKAGGEVVRFSDAGVTRLPSVWKASDTSFFAYVDVGFKNTIFKVVGHKLTLGLQTP